MPSNRDPRKNSRINRNRRTSSSTRATRSTASSKDTPKPTSSANRANTKGTSTKVTNGRSQLKSTRLQQSLDGVKTKRTPAKTPPKVKTNKPSTTPRGAQGPRTAPRQGPYQKPPSAVRSVVPKPTTTPKAPPTQKYKPRVSNVGPQIRQTENTRSANPGRAVRAARNAGTVPANETPGQRIRRTGGTYRGMKYPGGGKPGVRIGAGARRGNGKRGGIGDIKTTLAGGLVTAAAVGSLRNPITKAKAKAKPNRKEGQKATLNGKPVVWRKGKWVPAPEQSAGKYNTRDADGTVRSRARVGTKTVGTAEQAFDKAYATAKKAGKKTFTFNGKKYSTK